MTKREVFQLLSMIACYYEHFELDQERVNAWTKVLKPYDFEPLEQNLIKHVTESPYPPKISELVRKKAAGARTIPNDRETEHSLKSDYAQASPEVVQAHLAKLREILGIKREER